MFVYVENTVTGIRFEVVSYDKETKTARLRGAFGAEFSRDISKPSLEKYNFKLVKSEKELPLADRPGLQKVGTIAA